MSGKKYKTEQEKFWVQDYAEAYRKNNKKFDTAGGIEAWDKMLRRASDISNILECGSNTGRNIESLNSILPDAKKSIIEISPEAFEIVSDNYEIEDSYNGSIISSEFDESNFDLVFTMCVLIHIHPDDLLENMKKLFDYSRKYILIGEYFNRTPVMIEYHGQKERLFKRDFGRMFIENFDVKLLDYGFQWGWLYDNAGFDDVTWWLFKK